MRHGRAGSGAGPRVLLTGRPGIGKTTVIRRVIESIGAENCAGFYTEEVREGGGRLGFDVVTTGGRRGALARLGSRPPRVGRYSVDVASFERYGVAALEAAMRHDDQLLIIDEIGKMELLSERFRDILAALFAPANPRAILGSVMTARHPLVDALRASGEVEVLAVTLASRDGLPGELLARFEAVIDDGPAGG